VKEKFTALILPRDKVCVDCGALFDVRSARCRLHANRLKGSLLTAKLNRGSQR